MKKEIRFYNEGHCWYADVPQHTKEDNLMVRGSDTLLSTLVPRNRDFVRLVVDSCYKHYTDDEIAFRLTMVKHDAEGATYSLSGKLMDELNLTGQEIWLCNVVHTVFDEHPKGICVLEVKLK